MLRHVIVPLAAILFLTMSSPAALAHAILEQSWPRAAEQVVSPPLTLRLRFSERIEPALARVTLTTASGDVVPLGEPALEAGSRRTLVVSPTRVLASGDYEVRWRVVSADGHPSEGRFRFSVAP